MIDVKYIDLRSKHDESYEMYVNLTTRGEAIGLGESPARALYDLYTKIKKSQKEFNILASEFEAENIVFIDSETNLPKTKFLIGGILCADLILQQFKELRDANKIDTSSLINKMVEVITWDGGGDTKLFGKVISWVPLLNYFEVHITDLDLCCRKYKDSSAEEFKDKMLNGYVDYFSAEDLRVIPTEVSLKNEEK